MKWIKLKHQQCDNFIYIILNKKKKKKKDNKRLSQPNQAQFGSDILSNTRPASSRTKKRQQKQQKFNKTKPKE